MKGLNMIKTLYVEQNPTDDWWKRLSYILDWREAFQRSPQLELTMCNTHHREAYREIMKGIAEYELIVISHSAAGDWMDILTETAGWFLERKGKLAVFIGNEYDIMDQKIAFLNSVEADFICTQLPMRTARYVYEECKKSVILEMPQALNPRFYRPLDYIRKRVDIGFNGDVYPPWVGDMERTEVIEYFKNNCSRLGLTCDIRSQRVARERWVKFLNACRAIIGAEAGTYFFNERGGLMTEAKLYYKQYPDTDFDTMYRLFFEKISDPVPGKLISSRHFEPMGTKTCQVLLEGFYNGILKPDVHYIALKKGFTNIDDVVERLKDESYRRHMVENTYEFAMDEHTHDHRVRKLVEAVTASRTPR